MLVRSLALTSAVAVLALGAALDGNRRTRAPKPTVILVHGAFADAGSWSGVISRLRGRGYPVLAPANPLRGPAADAGYLRSVLETVRGPVVLVGHSYAGQVITTAAVGDRAVRALVYVAAVAPDQGESQKAINARFPPTQLSAAALVERPFPGGVDLYLDPRRFRAIFAADTAPAKAAIMATTQRPLAAAALTERSGRPAWRTIPSWYAVAERDQVISPAAERFMARRARAHTVHIDSAHDMPVSHPDAVTELILDAARLARPTTD